MSLIGKNYEILEKEKFTADRIHYKAYTTQKPVQVVGSRVEGEEEWNAIVAYVAHGSNQFIRYPFDNRAGSRWYHQLVFVLALRMMLYSIELESVPDEY